MILYDLVKYLVQGLGISLAIYLTNKSINTLDLLMLSLTICAILIIFNIFSPTISNSVQDGIGLGLGLKTAGLGGGLGGLGGGSSLSEHYNDNDSYSSALLSKDLEKNAGTSSVILNEFKNGISDVQPYNLTF